MKLNHGGIADLIEVVKGDVANKQRLDELQIDTIVNAAKPTLMGSDQGVDGAIHRGIDREEYEGFLNEQIRNELDAEDETLILCNRGHAVTTSGQFLCERIIHAVGIPYDGNVEKGIECSSSRVHTLETCYYSIIEQIKNHPDVRNVAIPIIGSGEYGFPFDSAVEIAIASIGNALVEWYQQDPEIFEMTKLEHVYFFIYGENAEIEAKKLKKAEIIKEKYRESFQKNEKVVFQTSWVAHKRYWQEVKKYDEMRGYFSLARSTRAILLIARTIFFLPMLIKDWFAKNNWKKRRRIVERIAFGKLLLSGVSLWACMYLPLGEKRIIVECIATFIIGYCMFDTITYLLTLILLADIQRPSANIIRSMILLFVNYIEVSFDMAYIYYFCESVSGRKTDILDAMRLGFFGIDAGVVDANILDQVFLCANEGIRFFFITIIFGYFASSMKLKQFKS